MKTRGCVKSNGPGFLFFFTMTLFLSYLSLLIFFSFVLPLFLFFFSFCSSLLLPSLSN
ncbi:hypothetical protein RchiOBHm_Chr1g0327031 [Rosa chinensis]|uniref:Uncharacterized protein n=1 Tax=Rosa chinensis TaxID=74649 RepID=A0A2P6SAG4_ROSCH|nr:hypothetical protein RchiOBHm_Chr1g0327031 [Rosa chinensis]